MKQFSLLIVFATTVFTTHAQADWTIGEVLPLDYQIPGKTDFDIFIENVGAPGISSFEIFWSLNNGAVNSVTKAQPDIKWNSFGGLVSDPGFTVMLTQAPDQTLKVWIKSFPFPDPNSGNDTLVKNIKVSSTLPKKNVLLEVYKHQTCGPCYRAANYTDTTASVNPLYAVANIYTVPNELLYIPDGKTINDFYGFAHPMPVFDRYKFPAYGDIGTGYSSGPNGYYLREYGSREQYFEPVEVFLDKVNFEEATRTLMVTVGAEFYDNLDGDYRFNLYLTEDSIKGYQASAPDPNNYYHKRVVRAMLGGAWGKQGSLPASIKTGDKKYHTFTYQIPQDYKTEKMHLIGIVQTYNSGGEKRKILNTTHHTFEEALVLSASDIHIENSGFKLYPNPAKNYIAISSGKAVKYTVLITDVTGKVCRRSSCKGNTKIDIQPLAAGNYFVYIDDGKVVYTSIIVKE